MCWEVAYKSSPNDESVGNSDQERATRWRHPQTPEWGQ